MKSWSFIEYMICLIICIMGFLMLSTLAAVVFFAVVAVNSLAEAHSQSQMDTETSIVIEEGGTE